MARSNIPQFGNWQTGSNVPYTQCFENVRKGKKDKAIINPNDPQENPEFFQSDNNNRPHQTPPRAQLHDGNNHPNKIPPRAQLHDGNNHPNQTPPRTPQNDYQPRGQFAPPTRRPQFAQEPKERAERQNPNDVPPRLDLKSDAKPSPRHPKFQASPARDSPGGNNAGSRTPGRSPMGGAAGGRKAAIPEFGGWANNPSTEPTSYTMIFAKAREDRKEEKQAPTPAIPPVHPRTPQHHSHNHGYNERSSKSWFSNFLRKVKGVFTGR